MAGVIHASHCHSTVHAQQQTHRCKGYTRHAAAVAAPLGMPAHERQAEASSHVRCTTHIDLNSQHERPGAYIRPFDSRSPSAGGVTTAERARRTEAPTPPHERTQAAAEAIARASIRETGDQHRTAAQACHFTVCSLQTTFAVRTQAVQSPPRKAHNTAAIAKSRAKLRPRQAEASSSTAPERERGGEKRAESGIVAPLACCYVFPQSRRLTGRVLE